MRLDKYLVENGYVVSRTKAQKLIEENFVLVDNITVNKLSFDVKENSKVTVKENDIFKFVSRGGFKLLKAIEVFNIDFNNKIVMDIGSSTGGFTDCALQHGAKKVIAIDVGNNLLHPSLRTNKKIQLYENTNIKDILPELFNNVDIIVVDVSFISLSKIIEKVASQNKQLNMMCLIKPQFECGAQIAKKFKGIVLDKNVHKSILNNTIKMFESFKFNLLNLDYSPIVGGDGNIEYICYISNFENGKNNIDINKVIESAFLNHKS